MSSSTLDIELDAFHHHWADHHADMVFRDEEGLSYRVSSHFLGMHSDIFRTPFKVAQLQSAPIETGVPGENLQALFRFVHSQFSQTSPSHEVMLKHTFPNPLAAAGHAKLYVFCRLYRFESMITLLEDNLHLWINWSLCALENLFEIAGDHRDVGLVKIGLKLLPHAKMTAVDYDRKAGELPPEWQRAFLMCLVKGDLVREGEAGFAKEPDPRRMADKFGRYIEVRDVAQPTQNAN